MINKGIFCIGRISRYATIMHWSALAYFLLSSNSTQNKFKKNDRKITFEWDCMEGRTVIPPDAQSCWDSASSMIEDALLVCKALFPKDFIPGNALWPLPFDCFSGRSICMSLSLSISAEGDDGSEKSCLFPDFVGVFTLFFPLLDKWPSPYSWKFSDSFRPYLWFNRDEYFSKFENGVLLLEAVFFFFDWDGGGRESREVSAKPDSCKKWKRCHSRNISPPDK